jgi:hypothetical protein
MAVVVGSKKLILGKALPILASPTTQTIYRREQGNSLIGADAYVTSGRRAGGAGQGHVAVGLTYPHTYDVERSDFPPTRSLRRHVVETEGFPSRIISARLI